jgi:hypothetical protein
VRQVSGWRKGEPAFVVDAELLALADRVEGSIGLRVRRARRLATDPYAAHMGTREEARATARRTLARVLRAVVGVRDREDGSYPDARFRFTECILDRAAILRGAAIEARVGKRAEPKATMAMAIGVADTIASEFPQLSARMRERPRILRTLAAIASASKSAKRVPWQLIVGAWDGIEAKVDVDTWRVAWSQRKGRTVGHATTDGGAHHRST